MSEAGQTASSGQAPLGRTGQPLMMRWCRATKFGLPARSRCGLLVICWPSRRSTDAATSASFSTRMRSSRRASGCGSRTPTIPARTTRARVRDHRRPGGATVRAMCRWSSIQGMRARLDLARGPLSIAALRGQYDLEQESVRVNGPSALSRRWLPALDARRDGQPRQSYNASTGRSAERCRWANSGGSLSADLDERTVSLEGGVRLKIQQGAVR